LQNANFLVFSQKTPIFAKNANFAINADFHKNDDFCKNANSQKCKFFKKTPIFKYFSQKTPIFAKMLIFAKHTNFHKVKYFSKIRKAAEKLAKSWEKKVFLGVQFLQKALGNFGDIQSDF
jgi:hypothetical protein